MKPKMSVGRCCCDAADCIYCEDDFDRANSSDIDTGSDCGWTEESGNPTIASNELSFPAAGIATSDTTQAGSTPKIRVEVDGECASSGDTARIIFNFVDTSNYDYFEMKVGAASAGSIRLVTVSSGTPTTVDSVTSVTIPTAVMHTLCLSYSSGQAVGSWTEGGGGSGLEAVWGEVTEVNGVVGLGTDSGCLFDDFSFQKHSSLQTGCGLCLVKCGSCSAGGPGFLLVTIADLIDDSCTDCDDATSGFNKTFAIGAADLVAGPFACWYGRTLGESTGCGGSNRLDVGIYSASGNTKILGRLRIDGGNQDIAWEYTGVSGIEDCTAYVDKDIPFSSELGTSECDAVTDSATMKITAIA